MRYVHDFRDPEQVAAAAAAIRAAVEPGRHYRFMEFCGGHTHALCKHGLLDLLPPEVEMIHGPGCPVCVLPIGRLDQAIAVAREPGVVLATYGDMMRVPGSDRASLFRARAEGADVRMVLSADAAVDLAVRNPDREVVFFAIGFETTTPPTAAAAIRADRTGVGNFSILVNHVLTPSAIEAILASDVAVDGLVGPGHVSVVIGTEPYLPFTGPGGKPIVIAGFEPLDLLQAIAMLVHQVNQGRARLENQYTRAVTRDGNLVAQALCRKVFALRPDFEWRGLGTIPTSALTLAPAYAHLDAERRSAIGYRAAPDHKACACADILRGKKRPFQCKVFGTACTPDSPLGACMVSPEGSCAAFYAYRAQRGVPASGAAGGAS